MYNEEQKRRYLNQIKGVYVPESIANFNSLFNNTEAMERELGKDVSLFSRQDISNLYSLLGYGNKYTYAVANSKLCNYTEWCVNQMLVPDGCNHFQEFSMNDYSSYVNERIQRNRYMTKEEVYELLNEIVNPRDQYLILSFFEFGKSENYTEIVKLKIQDIDFEQKKAKLCTGRTVFVSDKWLDIARKAYEATDYTSPLSGKTRIMYFGDTIFRRVVAGRAKETYDDNPEANNKLITRIMKDLVSLVGINKGVNASSIAVSGQIDMIRRRSQELGISKKDYVLNHFDELQSQYNMSPNTPRRYFNRFEAYL